MNTFGQKDALENAACKIVVILFGPQRLSTFIFITLIYLLSFQTMLQTNVCTYLQYVAGYFCPGTTS